MPGEARASPHRTALLTARPARGGSPQSSLALPKTQDEIDTEARLYLKSISLSGGAAAFDLSLHFVHDCL